jgi:hypothetical protein
MGWKAISDSFSGVATVKHAVLTVGGTWESAPGTQYPSNVINGLNEFINPDLVQEVPIGAPFFGTYAASFGPIGGPITSPSYQQSVTQAYDSIGDWLAEFGLTQTWGLGGYSQGAEATSRVAMSVMGLGEDDWTQFLPTFIGGYTFGNPCRMAGAVAPGVGNPGPQWRGISSVNMTELPAINGVTVWADYAHSTANGDPANDLYAMVPVSDVGIIMTDVYTAATEAQLNDITVFTSQMVSALEQLVSDSGILSGLSGGIAGLLGEGIGAALGFFIDLAGAGNIESTGVQADVEAAVLGLQFLAAPGGSTMPHTSYLGPGDGQPEYSNLVADGVNFLNMIATLTPPRS